MSAETIVPCSETAVGKHLVEALDCTDDWTAISDPIARRKLQNRLNQRARRRRQDPVKSTPLRSKQSDVQNGHQAADTSRRQWQWTATSTTREYLPDPSLQITVYRRHKPDLCFPLSADHLIHLVQLNVYRAFLANMLSLGRTSIFTCDTDLDEQDGRVLSTLSLPAPIPPLLKPTQLQQTTPHADWIDLFPLPALRDALIQAHGTYDDCALYMDVLGSIGNKTSRHDGKLYCHTSPPPGERTGVIVWSDPWLVESWELEEGFVRRWSWLLAGSGELLQATNRWRRLRGDDAMDWIGLAVYPDEK